MEQLKLIIENGTKDNEKTITPTIDEKIKIKLDILSLLQQKDVFVMNKKFFDWKKKLVDKKESSEQPEWLLEPLTIYCNDPEELAKKICDFLLEKEYKFIRARRDIFPQRIIVEVEFEINSIICPINKSLSKHTDYLQFYGANINSNGELLLPIFLYEYITPKFNYENWKSNLELEPFLWGGLQQKWIKRGVSAPIYSNLDISKKMFELIKSEEEGSYLMTGYFTYFMMTNQKGEYNGNYHIYHREPLEFLKKIYEKIPELTIREDPPIYYFQNTHYYLKHNNDHILTIYKLDYPMNFVRLGYYNHTNYHGLLLFLLLEGLKSTLKEYEHIVGQIGFLVKSKNSYTGGHNFDILQNNIIGPRTSPMLEFKLKEWNKELTDVFFYRPDKVEVIEKEDSEKEST